jgi:hypothetical protein
MKEMAMEARRGNGARMIVVATDRQNVLERIEGPRKLFNMLERHPTEYADTEIVRG